jgi:hypothetical protein
MVGAFESRCEYLFGQANRDLHASAHKTPLLASTAPSVPPPASGEDDMSAAFLEHGTLRIGDYVIQLAADLAHSGAVHPVTARVPRRLLTELHHCVQSVVESTVIAAGTSEAGHPIPPEWQRFQTLGTVGTRKEYFLHVPSGKTFWDVPCPSKGRVGAGPSTATPPPVDADEARP